MLKIGLILLSALAAVETQNGVSEIDRQIAELRQLQEKTRSSAERNANNAMRWQFQKDNYLDARKAWDKAAQEKKATQEIQVQIDQLEQQKIKILQENDETKSP